LKFWDNIQINDCSDCDDSSVIDCQAFRCSTRLGWI